MSPADSAPMPPPVAEFAVDALRVVVHADRAALGRAAAARVARAVAARQAEAGVARLIFAAAPIQDEFLDALAAPGVVAGGLLVFLTGMKELTATLVLHPTGSETLAMRLWTTTEVGQFAAAAPYAALIVLLAAVPGWLVARAGERGRGPGTDRG